jgi:aspartate racemase
MHRIGVLGGMGPAATVDFLDQLVRLTPAHRDQDHLPVLAAFLTQVPDRSAAILGQGPDPLPALLEGIALLNQSGVDVIAIPCNSAHHWHAQLSARSNAPVLHIARACAQRLSLPPGTPVLVLGTRGVQRSGLYVQALDGVGLTAVQADALGLQDTVDRCIAQVKKARANMEGDEAFGFDAIAEALALPLRTIAENAGEKGTVVVSKVAEMKGNEGFNALTRTYGDLIKAGVITPAKVDRCALQNAASVAGLLLTADCIITEAPKAKDEAAGEHAHGHAH